MDSISYYFVQLEIGVKNRLAFLYLSFL